MTALDLDAVRERYAAWEAAQEAAYGLPGSAAARECDERAMDCGHDVPALLAEIVGLRATLNLRDGQLTSARRYADERGEEIRRLRRERDDARADVREAGKEMRQLEADLKAAYSQIEELP